jgi:hypothetical protein
VDNVAHAIADAVVARLTPLLESRTLVPRLLTVAQAAIYLGRTEKAVRHLVRDGLPCVRSDSRVMLDVKDLDKWIEANKWDSR